LPGNNLKLSIGRGIDSEIFGYKGRIKSFSLGDYTFDNPIVSFNERKRAGFEKEGNLGSGIISRFHVIIDFPNRRMFLKPNKYFNKPFEFNMAGIQYTKTQNSIIKINTVIPKSPASEAGIKVNDEILKINNVDATKIDSKEVENIFLAENKTVELTLKRGDETKTISIKLRRII
jgi:hypothetical protein